MITTDSWFGNNIDNNLEIALNSFMRDDLIVYYEKEDYFCPNLDRISEYEQ